MFTALFNLVWNTKKSKWRTLFECQVKMFLSIEKVLEKIGDVGQKDKKMVGPP